MEEPSEDGALTYFDTLISPGPNNTLTTTVYRKLTHIDKYLHWDSSHSILAKTASLTHWHTGQGWSIQISLCYNRKMNTLENHCLHAISPWALNRLQV